jgi:hypothetical protein
MTRCEKYAFAALVQAMAPEVAIEIGTYQGGSLQVISQHARKVYSIDKSLESERLLRGYFHNVEFITGDSKKILPGLLEKIHHSNEKLGLVLVDGDHSTEGVKADIEAVLQYIPTQPLYIIFHDSFHPRSRQGILAVDWERCRHVHYVEVDFIPGVYHFEAFDTAQPRSMYGGLALALMRPEARSNELAIYQSQKGLYDTVFPHSCHAAPRQNVDLLRRVKRKLFG